MNKKLLAKINRALENTKVTCLAPVTKEALQKRLTEELDWVDADPDRWACIKLLNDVMEKVRSAGIVSSPGYGHLTSSFLLYLVGVTRVNPVEWDLPFSRFLRSFGPDTDLVLETGTGGIAVAEKVLQHRDEFIIETEPGTFQITFMDGYTNANYRLRVLEYSELDRFKSTIKDGWHPLDKATLRLFSCGITDGSIWFETDKMREWLMDFDPESMSDLVLLRAIYYPGRIALFPELLRRKQNPSDIPSTGDERTDRILRDTYGILVYQEQVMMLQDAGYLIPKPNGNMDKSANQVRLNKLSPMEIPFKELAVKGHEVARTILSVEALWPRRFKTSLR